MSDPKIRPDGSMTRRWVLLLIAGFSIGACKSKPPFIKKREVSRRQIMQYFSSSKLICLTTHSSINITENERGTYVEHARFNLEPAKANELALIFDKYTSLEDPDGPILRMARPKHTILFINAVGDEDFKIDIDFDTGLLQARDRANNLVNFQYSNKLIEPLRDFFTRNSYK